MEQKTLYMLSISYPYGKGESFLYKELKELSRYYDRIVIIPEHKKPGEARWVPANAVVDHCLAERGTAVSRKDFFKGFSTVFAVLMTELFKSGKFFYVLKKSKLLSHYILMAKAWAEVLQKKYTFTENDVIYSVWNDEAALCCALLKRQKKIPAFSLRLHGFDLYDDRRDGHYMPFRSFIFKYARRVFVVSKAGYEYMKDKKIFPEKLVLNYSGVYDNGINPHAENQAEFTLVSCSNINEVKRVDIIAKALMHTKTQINWYHFGDGPLKEPLLEVCKKLPAHVKLHLMGHVKNEELLAFYREHPIDLFIHVSSTEGLVMVLVEAQSFGIPVLACSVGGVPEILSSETGYLVPADVSPQQLATIIDAHKTSGFNSPENRKKIRAGTREKFDAEKNYLFFNDQLQKA